MVIFRRLLPIIENHEAQPPWDDSRWLAGGRRQPVGQHLEAKNDWYSLHNLRGIPNEPHTSRSGFRAFVTHDSVANRSSPIIFIWLGQESDHRDGLVQVRLGGRSADIARRLPGRLHASLDRQEDRRL